jgi:hypothetical protein
VLRVLYVLVFTRYQNSKIYDAYWYEHQSLNLVEGHFFPIVFGPLPGPDAAHPPLVPIVLAPVTYVFGLHTGATPQRLTMAVLGAAVVLFVGILARTVAGPRVGLVAAFVAAVYPNMWIPNGIVMSETLNMLLMALILLAAYRLLRSPTWGNAALTGLAIGVELLARAELVLLVPFLLFPAAWACRTLSVRRRLALATLALVVIGCAVGPWVGRNLVSFRDPTFMSTAVGPLLLGTNCAQTYYGPWTGSFSLTCQFEVPKSVETEDQSVGSEVQTREGLHYVDHHLTRLPVVVAARVARMWDFYEPLQMADIDVNEGRPVPASLAGLFMYYALLPVAAIGVVVLRRRRVVQWPLLVVVPVGSLVAAVGFGLVRYRAEAEVTLVILAAVGVVALWDRFVVGRVER